METKDLKIKVLQTYQKGFDQWRAFIDLMDKDIELRDFEEYMEELGVEVRYGRKPI